MSSKSSKKAKKPLDLPLGKAISAKDVDLSHVRLPIDTSVFGLKNVLTLFETATSEVKSYLAYECDLMYECRVCRTIFRSLANFVLHKRKFCRDRYNNPKDPGQSCRENDGVAVIQRDIDNANQIIVETEVPGTKKSPGSYLNPIIENLLKRQEQKKFVEEIKNESVVNLSKNEEPKKVGDVKSISLEKIDGSSVAMFQTMEFGPTSENTESMKSEVMEIHSIFDRDEAVIGSNGKILTMNSKDKDDKQILKNDHICTECNTKFSTKKTLTYHIKYKHSETKLVYPCPVCKDNLSNAWSVYRHLLKVHRMTSNQIRKYRNQIHNGAIYKKPEDNKERKKNTRESRHGNDAENEWLDNIEGDSDLQMCGGCGKHFERKAALISHSVMCTKRIAVCNSIKENNSKKKELDIKENEEKFRTTKLTGSAKRKSANLITYKPKTENSPDKIHNEEPIIESEAKENDTGILSLVIEEDDSDEENCREWMKKDIQMYDKSRVMSIIGVDISSNENISSKVSDRSDSPCRGFENVKPSDYVEHVKIDELSNLTKSSKGEPEASENSKHVDSEAVLNKLEDKLAVEEVSNNSEQETEVVDVQLDPEVVSNISDEKETKYGFPIFQPDDAEGGSNASDNSEYKTTRVDVSVSPTNSSSKSSSESEAENSSEISLDNKLNSDFKLDLCDDPNFQDVSIKSLIKEIIEDDIDSETKDVPNVKNNLEENTVCNGIDDENGINEDTVKHCTKEVILNNNHEVEIVENLVSEVESNVSERVKKRKRINSSPQRNLKKNSLLNSSEENLNDLMEDEVFISKISRYADISNLLCTLCESQFNSISEFLPHMSNHLSWYRFQCSRCSFMSYNKCDCEKHVQKEHKLSLNHIQGTVLPIPTWKSSLISDNFMLLECPSNDGASELGSENVGEVDMLIDMKVKSVKVETAKECSEKDERKILSYIDLTIEENPSDDTDFAEVSENCLSPTNTRGIQDLSKQAIMEVILGNRKENPEEKCVSSKSCDNARPLRNRTKSVKTSQKDFIYDFDSLKGTSIKGHNSKGETEHIPEFEVQE